MSVCVCADVCRWTQGRRERCIFFPFFVFFFLRVQARFNLQWDHNRHNIRSLSQANRCGSTTPDRTGRPMEQKRSWVKLAHSCATQEKHTHSRECFPSQSQCGETLRNLVHVTAPGKLSSVSTKKIKNKILISYFSCRRISSYTLTPKAGGAAPFALTRQEALPQNPLKWRLGRRKFHTGAAAEWRKKTLASVSGCQPLELSSHHGGAFCFRDLTERQPKNIGWLS